MMETKPQDRLPVIQIEGITKVYGEAEAEVHALAGVDLKVEQGEFVAIMGPSGSGKSTLMNILGCLDRPTSGSYLLDGENVSQMSKDELAQIRNQKLGFIFQSFNLLPRLTAKANVMLPMLYNLHEDVTTAEAATRALGALESVGLKDRVNHRPSQLSGGQQQRVAIARALVNNPSVIFADEPTGNLDSKSSVEILDLLHNLHKDGATIVMVTHEPKIAQQAGRVICVMDGLVLDGSNGANTPCMEKRERA
jgi:putative ABC transport system ATP-binding protein